MRPVDVFVMVMVAIAPIAVIVVVLAAHAKAVFACAAAVAALLVAGATAALAHSPDAYLRFAGPPPSTFSSVPTTPPSTLAPSDLTTPPPPVSQRVSLTNDEAATVKVLASACGEQVSGSGFVVAPDLVVTNAHVVAGDPAPVIQEGPRQYAATPVLFDPQDDLAILRVAKLTIPPLRLAAATVAPITQARVLGYPYGGPLSADNATVLAHQHARTSDIYGRSRVERDIYQVRGRVRPGNSGGPLVGMDGQVLGVVFAYSTDDTSVGYVLTSAVVSRLVQSAVNTGGPVGDGPCAAESSFIMQFGQA